MSVDLASPAPARSPAAERMRLYRERRRSGLRCLLIELRETEIDALIRRGLLKSEMRNVDTEIIDALYAHLDRSLGQTT
jgi:ketopantoate reductase